MERLQVLGIFTSLSGQLGVEAMILFLHQLLPLQMVEILILKVV